MQNAFRRPKYYMCRIVQCMLAMTLVWFTASKTFAQEETRILKANSPIIKIVDGTNASRGDWILDPTLALDVYYAIRSDQKRTISFHSDVDSRSFEVEPGQVYDFEIMLNGKDACKTRISTVMQGFERMDQDGSTSPIAIPITIEHGKLHLKGRINGSETLDLIFDTGADSCLVYPSAMSKGVTLTLDGRVLNAGSGGVTERQVSRDNRIEIADVRWNHASIIYVEKQADRADGIVGYTLLEHRIVEFDFDRMQLLIHDSLPSHIGGFSKTAMPFVGSLPAVEVVMADGNNAYRGPFILDTAGNGCMLVNQSFAREHNLHGTLRKVGTGVSRGVGSGSIHHNQLMMPTLSIAGHSLRDVPLHVELPSDWNQAPPGGVLCMDVLGRFHAILDFPANEAYFQPNSRFAEPFRIHRSDPLFTYIAGMVGIALFAIAAVVSIGNWRSKRV